MKKYIKPVIDVTDLKVEASLCAASDSATPSNDLGENEIDNSGQFHSRESYGSYSVWGD